MAVSADQRAILEEIRVNLAGLQAELRKMSDNMRDNLSKMVATCNGIINTCSSVSKSVMVSDDGITEVDTSLDVEAKDIDSLEKVVHSKDGQIGDALNLFDEMLLRLAPQEKDAYWHSINSSTVISIKVIATNDSITPTFESTSTDSGEYQMLPLLLYLDELNTLRPPNSGDFKVNGFVCDVDVVIEENIRGTGRKRAEFPIASMSSMCVATSKKLPPLKTANGYIVVPVRSNNSYNCPSKRDMIFQHEWRPGILPPTVAFILVHLNMNGSGAVTISISGDNVGILQSVSHYGCSDSFHMSAYMQISTNLQVQALGVSNMNRLILILSGSLLKVLQIHIGVEQKTWPPPSLVYVPATTSILSVGLGILKILLGLATRNVRLFIVSAHIWQLNEINFLKLAWWKFRHVCMVENGSVFRKELSTHTVMCLGFDNMLCNPVGAVQRVFLDSCTRSNTKFVPNLSVALGRWYCFGDPVGVQTGFSSSICLAYSVCGHDISGFLGWCVMNSDVQVAIALKTYSSSGEKKCAWSSLEVAGVRHQYYCTSQKKIKNQ